QLPAKSHERQPSSVAAPSISGRLVRLRLTGRGPERAPKVLPRWGWPHRPTRRTGRRTFPGSDGHFFDNHHRAAPPAPSLTDSSFAPRPVTVPRKPPLVEKQF